MLTELRVAVLWISVFTRMFRKWLESWIVLQSLNHWNVKWSISPLWSFSRRTFAWSSVWRQLPVCLYWGHLLSNRVESELVYNSRVLNWKLNHLQVGILNFKYYIFCRGNNVLLLIYSSLKGLCSYPVCQDQENDTIGDSWWTALSGLQRASTLCQKPRAQAGLAVKQSREHDPLDRLFLGFWYFIREPVWSILSVPSTNIFVM